MEATAIRPARPEDAAALLAIYAPYVEKTAVTFEYQPPSLEELAGRIRRTLARYPYLAAEREGRILGYAYAGPFHPRPAYCWSAEASIYVAEAARGSGVGGALGKREPGFDPINYGYKRLVSFLESMNRFQLNRVETGTPNVYHMMVRDRHAHQK